MVLFDIVDPARLLHVKRHGVDRISEALTDLAEGEVGRSDLFVERRGRSRVILELPLDYRLNGARSSPCAGIVRNGSETGLLICSLREIPIGTEVDVDVMFADEYELSHFEGSVRVVRTIRLADGKQRCQQGVEFFRIDEANYRKFKRLLLSCREKTVDRGGWFSFDMIEEESSPIFEVKDSQLAKKNSLLGRLLLKLAGKLSEEDRSAR